MRRFLGLVGAVMVMMTLSRAAEEMSVTKARLEFEQADRKLNAAWAEARRSLGKAEFEVLQSEQRQWLEYREHIAMSPGYSGAPVDEKAARKSAEYLGTAAALMESRAEWLRGVVKSPVAEPLTGVWSDSYGGRMSVVEKGGRLYFSIEVVRGPTAHLGDISGVASWNSPLGWFSDKGLSAADTEETNLALIQRGVKLEVVGANTGKYHGARAYFDGQYVKVKELTAEEQETLLKEGTSKADGK